METLTQAQATSISNAISTIDKAMSYALSEGGNLEEQYKATRTSLLKLLNEGGYDLVYKSLVKGFDYKAVKK